MRLLLALACIRVPNTWKHSSHESEAFAKWRHSGNPIIIGGFVTVRWELNIELYKDRLEHGVWQSLTFCFVDMRNSDVDNY